MRTIHRVGARRCMSPLHLVQATLAVALIFGFLLSASVSGASTPAYLPTSAGETVKIEVSLAP